MEKTTLNFGDTIEVLEDGEWVKAKFLNYYDCLTTGVFYFKGDFPDLKKVNNCIVSPFAQDGEWRVTPIPLNEA